MTAYIYGFICHFALDRECHGYIDEKIASSGVSHAEIEAEFDRALLVKDGYDPVEKKLTEHIQPVVHNARIISRFFPANLGVGAIAIFFIIGLILFQKSVSLQRKTM